MAKVAQSKNGSLHRHRRKTEQPKAFGRDHDRCFFCKAKYKRYPFKIVFKDVVECSRCGKILILQEDDVLRFSQ